MTLMPWDGPPWFKKMFPLGLCATFGPGDATRFTALEAAVLAVTLIGCREVDDIPVTAAGLARVRASLERKYEAYQRARWGDRLVRPGRLFPPEDGEG